MGGVVAHEQRFLELLEFNVRPPEQPSHHKSSVDLPASGPQMACFLAARLAPS
jgi:hypothetical protein